MKVEIITPSANPDRGGFGMRVHSLVSMFSQFSQVQVVLTDGLGGPAVPGVRYVLVPIRDTARTRIRRLRRYYRSDFPKRVTAGSPDIVVVESLDLLGLHQYGPGVPLILDEHNVYWNLLRYEMVNAPFFRGWLGSRAAVRRLLIPGLLERAKRFEIGAIRDSSRTLVTSDRDREAILGECPEVARRLRVLPNCVDVLRIPPKREALDSRVVLFVGDFNYVPNREAAKFVSGVLAPGLRGAQFLLVGRDPPPNAAGPNIVPMGFVPQLQEVLRDAAVCIAPLFHGSGTRLKILTYLSAAKAVVATGKACEGIPVRDGKDLLIRDDPEEFRCAVQDLLEDPERRRVLGANGREFVQSMYDWRVHVDFLRDLAAEVIAERGG